MYEYHLTPQIFTLKVFNSERGQSIAGVTPYMTGMLVTNMGMGWCRLHFVLGELNNQINKDVIEECRQRGFHRIYFETIAGENATRWAEFVEERNGLKRWVIDLEKPLKERQSK